MAIITISRQWGSLGTHIAKALHEELPSLKSLDKTHLEEILVNEYGIPEENVEKYDEKKPAFWDIFSSDKDRYLHFLKTAIYEFAKTGNCIIIGRGGQFLFKNLPGALHVKIIAPFELRLKRIQERYNYDEKLAEQILRRSDHDRIGFHKFFFHANWEDSGLYDLVINTKSFAVAQAVELVKTSLTMLTIHEKQAETCRQLQDLCLGQHVVTQIAYKEHLPIQFLEAQTTNGIVTLRGSTISMDDIGRAENVARQVPGVQQVVNEIYFIPNTYGMT